MGKKNRKPTKSTASAVAVAPVGTAPAAPVPAPVAPRHLFTPLEWVVAVLAFLVSGFVYFYTMTPEVTLQDSGELVTGAFNFGVPHPSGYPLWAFLGWVWRHLVPVGNPAWRLALFSVATGAALVGILTLLMSRSILMLLRNCPWGEALDDSVRSGLSVSVGTAAAMMFAFNRGVWQWACVPEMRALNAFSYVATTCILFAWMMRPSQHRFVYALLGVWGLSLANHQTIIVMLFPFVIGMWIVGFMRERTDRLRYSGLMELGFACLVAWMAGVLVNAWLLTGPNASLWDQQIKTVLLFGPKSEPMPVVLLAGGSAAALLGVGAHLRMMSWKRAVICAAIFLAALSMYAYMPVAASTNPPMNWGYAYTKQGFLHAITRGQYEQIRLSWPWTDTFWTQMGLFVEQLFRQYGWNFGWIFALFAALPVVALVAAWKRLKPRARQWLIFTLASFLITWVALIVIINPQVDKQNQEINLKFFVGAHGFFAMLIGYGLALAIAWGLARWPMIPRGGVVAGSWALVACAAIPFWVNWEKCEQRNHDFGYQFGYRMFYPGGDYPPMDQDAVLYGGTDPGRFVPTYMIFCESRVAPEDRYHDPHLDPEGGKNFDRRDVYIITQNALADSTYMSYIRDHYDYSRPDPNNPVTLERRAPWQRAVFRWAWQRMHRDTMYPKQPIWIPSEEDTQRAFREYVADVQARQARGEHLSADEQVSFDGGAVQVRGVQGVMNINGILTRWIFERNRDKHSFYVEESYVIQWMYPYLSPAGIIMKINKDPLPSPQENSALWDEIIKRDRVYWDKLCEDFEARPEFRRDGDAQKTFSKLRSAIGGIYAYRKLYPAAEYAFQQARRLCKESPEANFRLAQLYMDLGQPDKAVTVLKELQQLDPLNVKIQGAINQIQDSQKAPQEIARLEAARARDPHNLSLLGQIASLYARTGQGDRVVPLFFDYLSRPDVPAENILQIAQFFLQNGNLNDGLRALQILTQRYPGNAVGHYGQAVILTAKQQPEQAINALARAIELDPAMRDRAASDGQLSPLRENPRFKQLVGSASPAPIPAPPPPPPAAK
jgi:tetratricopeptide (TPR) repeat protein